MLRLLLVLFLSSVTAWQLRPALAPRARVLRSHPLLQAPDDELAAEVDSWEVYAAEKQAEADAYKQQAASFVEQDKAKIKAQYGGIDFFNQPDRPKVERGQGGLNDQGYTTSEIDPEPEKVGGAPVYIVGLGLAAVATLALSVSNMAS